jgi:hypothetical protein
MGLHACSAWALILRFTPVIGSGRLPVPDMPRVLNKKLHGVPPGAVYIGRPSKWGNPFVIGRDGSRDEVVAKYRAYLLAHPFLMDALSELRGKDLVCWCAPDACHGDVLVELANVSPPRDAKAAVITTERAFRDAMTEIFVFGSNEAGRHGKGAALHARKRYGAKYGVGFGRTGNAWAIPTKDAQLRTLPLERIAHHVGLFLIYAREHPELMFKVTAVGTGLAGYKHEDIAPMFAGAPANCDLPTEWRSLRASRPEP